MNESYDADNLPSPPWQTERLLLRPYTLADIEVAHETLDLDARVWRWDPGYQPTLEERRHNIARYAMLRQQFGFGPCAAFLRDSDQREGALIGQGGLNPYVYDHQDGTRSVEFEVMYKLSPDYWGSGYATEIARFWLDFAFREVQLSRVLVCPDRENVASVAVLRRLRAQLEDDWLDPETVIARFGRLEWLAR